MELRAANQALGVSNVMIRSQPALTAEAIKKLAMILGARDVHANVTDQTSLIIDADERPGLQIRQLVTKSKSDQQGQYDIVSAQWLCLCYEQGSAMPLEPRFVRYATPSTHHSMCRSMDECTSLPLLFRCLVAISSCCRCCALGQGAIAFV